MDFHIIFCDILDMITVDQIHICLIISPLAAKLKAYHRSITVNAQSAQVIYTAPVIGIKTGAISHIEIHVSRCTRRNRKLIRDRIILLVLLWERTQIIIDRCLMLCQQRGNIESLVDSLVGVIRDTGMTLEDYRAERLGKYENLD